MFIRSNNKGFIFIESVIVTVIIIALAIPLYVLTKNAINNFEIRRTYDRVDHLYDLNSVKSFLYRNYDVNILCDYVKKDENDQILLLYQNYSEGILYNLNLGEDLDKTFLSLINDMGIKKLFFTNYVIDLNSNKNITNKVNSDQYLKKYINYLNKDTSSQDLYRLIAEFDDGNFASINMYRLGK